jgi:hypothetical protein
VSTCCLDDATLVQEEMRVNCTPGLGHRTLAWLYVVSSKAEGLMEFPFLVIGGINDISG